VVVVDIAQYRVIFLIGKGGVGKTTCSSAIAVGLARKGYKTLIVSLDPAHNLGDVLMKEVGSRIKKVDENLWALEVDIDKVTFNYLQKLENSLKSLYKYLSVINLDKYFDVLRYSPGVEQYAILEAIKDVLAKRDEYDVIIFDTPPTGLTLRVFALPRTSLLWVDKLIELRRKILDRRLIVEKVHGERHIIVDSQKIKLPSKEEEDMVIKELKAYRSEIEEINKIITGDETAVIAVLNPDELSFLEMKRAAEVLNKFEIPLRMAIVNKVEAPKEIMKKVHSTFKVKVVEIQKKDTEVRGIDLLKDLFNQIEG
jgi:arsenite-transporting ATPase